MKRCIIYGLLIVGIGVMTPGTLLAQEPAETTEDALPLDDDGFPDLDDISWDDEDTIDVEEEGDSDVFPLDTAVNLSFTGAGRIINDDSRLNPENAIQDIDDGEVSFEAAVTVSDYLNEQQTLRWLFKSYSFYSSKADENEKRENITRIDELFVDWNAKSLFLNVGKRRINWGHAMAFNPVNVVVPPRDPLNPNQETEGQPIAWLSLSRDFAALDLIATRDFDKDWNSDLNRWGASLGLFVGEFDFSFYYFDGEPYPLLGGGRGGSQDDRDYERMYGASFSTNLTSGITLYSEVAGFEHNYRNYYGSEGTGALNDELYVQGVVGSYIILSGESFLSFFNGSAGVTLEAYYNSGGYSESERQNYYNTLDQALRDENPSVLGDYRFSDMNQFYALFRYSNSFKDRYTAELSGLFAQDLSCSLQAQLTYNLSDYYSLIGKVTHNQGGDESEFGNAPVSNLFELTLDINF